MNNSIKEKVLKANEELHDYFAKDHTRSVPYQSRRNTRNYIWNLIKEQLKINKVNAKNAAVLEVACGTGTFVGLFQNLKAKSYDGIDISSKMTDIAKQNNKYKNTNFYTVSLEEFSQENEGKYDIIIASSFLHHLVDLEEGLLQIKKLLKPNGIFIGLHEVINNRKLTKTEIFDICLAELFGYNGFINTPIKERINKFSNYVLHNQNVIKLNDNSSQATFKLFDSITLWKTKREQGKNKHYGFGFIPLGSTKPNNPSAPSEPDVIMFENGVNLVDYQLNFDFNLSQNEIAKKYGEVIPYCYYNFAELYHIDNVNNHNMFVMRKD